MKAKGELTKTYTNGASISGPCLFDTETGEVSMNLSNPLAEKLFADISKEAPKACHAKLTRIYMTFKFIEGTRDIGVCPVCLKYALKGAECSNPNCQPIE